MVEINPEFLDPLSYDATKLRRFWMDFIQDSIGATGAATRGGVVGTGDLAVSQNGTPNMSVNVAAGVAYVNGKTVTAEGMYRCYNDAVVNKAIAASHATFNRNDLVLAHPYNNLVDASGQNKWAIEVVTGTPSGSPVDPTITFNSYLLLARVVVRAASTSVITTDIINLRVNAFMLTNLKTFMAYSQITAPSATTTAGPIDSGPSVTVSVINGHRYKVTAHFNGVRGTSGDSAQVTITDGSNVRFLATGRIYIDASSVGVEGRTIIGIDLPGSTASKTYKMRHENVTGATATSIDAGADRPSYIMVEDMGLV